VAQNTIDLSKISTEKFVIIGGDLENFDKNKLFELLLVGIEISVDNIANVNTTRVSDSPLSYKYKYLIIYPDLSFFVREKAVYNIIYNPIHPDAIINGDMAGYVLYPAISIVKEYSDISEMIACIRKIEPVN
jgi:flagellar basal body rod protein FlgC